LEFTGSTFFYLLFIIVMKLALLPILTVFLNHTSFEYLTGYVLGCWGQSFVIYINSSTCPVCLTQSWIIDQNVCKIPLVFCTLRVLASHKLEIQLPPSSSMHSANFFRFNRAKMHSHLHRYLFGILQSNLSHLTLTPLPCHLVPDIQHRFFLFLLRGQ
jgi:hypothetical protein